MTGSTRVILFAGIFMLMLAGCGGGPGGDVDEQTADPGNRVTEVVARVGPIVAIRVGQSASLSGDNSYTSLSQPLSYHWSFASKPDDSNAVLLGANSRNPGFVADVRGEYRVQLVARAGGITSQRKIQLVVATVAPERLTGPFFHQGLSSACVNCHNDDFVAIPSKSQRHMGASNLCETCHTPLGWRITPFVDHQEVFGACSDCHDGVVAIGKSEFHIQTNGECDNCHNTISFFELNSDGSFDHTGITSGCEGCHNGTTATGKTPTPADTPPGTHPVTTAECFSCHTTDSFANAFPDHTDPAVIGPGCNTCHGVSATDNTSDPPAGHPTMTKIDSTTFDCSHCHGIATFSLGGVFSHGLVDPLVMTCETCHNDSNSINAPGKGSAVPAHPPTTEDCGVCHNTEDFAAATFDHTGIVNDCGLACHIADGSGSAIGMHATHMPTIEDCSLCHSPGSFRTGTYDHAGVSNGCNACHDNVITLGKLTNHIPTNPANQDCADCHNTTDFADVAYTHAGIDVNNCALCHDGVIASGKSSATHVPTAQNCFVCHNYTDPAFAPATSFSHSGITGNCESCHDGDPAFVAVGAIAKKTNHIPAPTQCVVCHDAGTTNPGDFSPSAHFLLNVHAAITNGCEGCHVSFFLPLPSNPGANLVKDTNHVPTAQDCDVCHNINGFTPTTMLAHSGITDNCVSCHNGSFVALGARAKTPSPPHPVTTRDCAFCHDTVNFANAFVDHTDPAVLAVRCDSCHVADGSGTAKGFDPGHLPTTQDCRTCHAAGGSFLPAVFDHSGIVDNCASCHVADGSGTAQGMDPGHIPTTQDCSVCHTPTAFAQARFEHQGITSNCGSCHNGTTATGKDADHVPTNGDCVDCHQTTGFKPATFDHAGIVDNCSSCHGAGFATGKNAGHVPTNQDCGVCHNTAGFVPATFDHTGITSGCESCHDGSTATGKIDAVPAHLTTSLDCYFCHTTATFTGGTWLHDSSTAGNCDTCHSPAGGATAKPGIHLSTTEQCDVCHTTNAWAPTVFSHDPNGNYPGDHRRNPGCTQCHGATISAVIPWRWPQYAPDCAACHAGDFQREGDHIGGSNGTVAQNRNCGGSGCHRVSDRGF